MKITRLTTDRLRVPFTKASRVSLTAPTPTAPDAVELILVHLETDTGVTGLGFAYVLGAGGAVRSLIDTELSPLIVGEDPRDTERLFARAEARFRTVGFGGLAARAYSAIDVALWDVKAKAAGVPLAKLLGGAKPAAAFVCRTPPPSAATRAKRSRPRSRTSRPARSAFAWRSAPAM